MTENMQSKAERYSRIKYALVIVDTLFLITFLILFQSLGLSNLLKAKITTSITSGLLVIAVYLFVLTLIYHILNFPLNLYRSFALEHKFNLSAQKFADWLKDQLKGFIVSYIIFLILVEAFYFILNKSPNHWWIITSLFWIFFSVILAKLTPIVLIPLFFKYKPLSDTELKERIINLSTKMKVKILNVFQIDFSKKTLKANAALTGWGKTKRVILADTLKDKYSPDEVEVILAHEFAHYRLRHLWKLILINSCVIILSFYVVFKSSTYILKVFNQGLLNDIAAFPVLAVYMILIGIITTPLSNALSRKFERDADKLAIEFTGQREAFISTMDKLSDQNLADRMPHPIIKFLFFDHPPIDERIEMARSL